MIKDKKIKWVIKLPERANIKVQLKDKVECGDLIAKVEIRKIESFDYSFIFAKLKASKLEELNEKFKKTAVSSGELLCVTGGLFFNKIYFPIDGKFLEIDEFGNLKIEKESSGFKEILAPVKAKVSKVEKGKVVLEFKAKEINGIGLVEGKRWGDAGLMVVNDAEELNSSFEGKILLTENLDDSFLLKAEVVGVVGVVSKSKKNDFKSRIPILYLEEDAWKILLNDWKKVSRCLINSRVGRLLLVSEVLE